MIVHLIDITGFFKDTESDLFWLLLKSHDGGIGGGGLRCGITSTLFHCALAMLISCDDARSGIRA